MCLYLRIECSHGNETRTSAQVPALTLTSYSCENNKAISELLYVPRVKSEALCTTF